VLVQGRQANGEPDAATVARPARPATDRAKLALDCTNDPNAQGRKEPFVASVDRRGDVNPYC